MDNLHRELAPVSDAAWDSIDATSVQLYFTESFTFAPYTSEASVSLAD